MAKNGIIIGVVVILIILGIAGYMVLGKSKSATTNQPAASNTKEESGVISSIKDAIANSMTLECDYSANGTSVKAYVKGGKVRSEITGKTASESGNAIIMDNKIYFWNAQGGFMMDMKDVSVTPGDAMANKGQSTIDELEAYKQYCKKANVDDSKFVLPANVKFQNMSDAMKMMKDLPKSPTGMSESDYEDLMKKYAPNQ